MMPTVRSAIAISGFVAAVLGCSGDGATALPPVQPLCDGSDDIRLVFTSFRGFASFGSQFSGKYGDRYLVVDGRCNYWLGSDGLRGLRTGTLDAHATTALAEDLHFGRYFTAADYRDPGGCTDAGLGVLDDGTATLRTACFPHDAPRVYREAFSGVYQLYAELRASGTSARNRTTLLAVRDPGELDPDLPGTPRTPLNWTAALDLEPRSVTQIELFRGVDSDAGVLVEDADTLAVLANLRANVRNPDPAVIDMLVRDARGRVYQLFVRDEPPDRVRNALEAALAAP
jgi:hypothetical protein